MKDRPKPVPCDAHRLQKRRAPTISIEKRRGLIELFVSYPEAAGYRAGYVATTTRPPAGHFDARASPRQERSPTARMSTLLQGERWGCCRAEVIWISASIKRPTADRRFSLEVCSRALADAPERTPGDVPARGKTR